MHSKMQLQERVPKIWMPLPRPVSNEKCPIRTTSAPHIPFIGRFPSEPGLPECHLILLPQVFGKNRWGGEGVTGAGGISWHPASKHWRYVTALITAMASSDASTDSKGQYSICIGLPVSAT